MTKSKEEWKGLAKQHFDFVKYGPPKIGLDRFVADIVKAAVNHEIDPETLREIALMANLRHRRADDDFTRGQFLAEKRMYTALGYAS